MLHLAVLGAAADVTPETHLTTHTRVALLLIPLGRGLLDPLRSCKFYISVGQSREDRCLPRLERVDIVDLIVILHHVET